MVEDTWKSCTPDGKPPLVGREYRCVHPRKGVFFGVVLSADEIWAKMKITSGVADALMDYNLKLEGETVSVRNSLCILEPWPLTNAAGTGA